MGEIIKVNMELFARANRLSKVVPGLSIEERRKRREEQFQCIKDLEFEGVAIRNHWSEEEQRAHRAEFDREYDKQQAEDMRLMGLALDILLFDSKGLSEEEIEEGKKYIEENPDLPDLIKAFLNMIDAGKNDPEHIMDYK